VHTVTGAPSGPPGHAARAPMPAAVWVGAAGLLVLAAGLVAAVGTLVPAGPVPSAPSSAHSITVTPTGR
jgi:hypothetical protein